MSYSFSIVGDTPDENSEWSLIQALADTIQKHQGIVSAFGNTQYHGVVDLIKVNGPIAANAAEIVPVVPNNQEKPVSVNQPPPVDPESTDNPELEATNPTTPQPEPSVTVNPEDESKEPEPELSETGEVVGFKEPAGTQQAAPVRTIGEPEPVLDPAGEVVGERDHTDTPPPPETR